MLNEHVHVLLWICGLSFHSFKSVFQREVLTLLKSIDQFCLLWTILLVSYLRNFAQLKVIKFYAKFSPRSFIVVDFAFGFMIYFDLVLYMIQGVVFCFGGWFGTCLLCQHHLLKSLSFSAELSLHIVKNQLSMYVCHICVGLFLVLLFYSTDLFVCLSTSTTHSWLLSFTISPEIMCQSFNFVFLFKV